MFEIKDFCSDLPTSLNIWNWNDNLCIRTTDGLNVYSFENNRWLKKHFCNEFSDKNGFNDDKYCLQFWKVSNQEILLCLTKCGYFFAKYDSLTNQIVPILCDKLFTRSYKQLEWGYFFGATGPLGLFSIHESEGVCFFGLINDPKCPIQRCQCDNINQLMTINGKFYFAELIIGSGLTNLIKHDQDGLFIYQVVNRDNKYHLDLQMRSEICSHKSGWKNDHDMIWFRRVTKSNLLNLITWQSDGLRVYTYELNNCYKCINHDASFSEENGWTHEHAKTIIFAELDCNFFSSILYTGPLGFMIKSFHQQLSLWHEQIVNLEIKLRYIIPHKVICLKQFKNERILIAKNLNGDSKNSVVYLLVKQLFMNTNSDRIDQIAVSTNDFSNNNNNNNNDNNNKRIVPEIGCKEQIKKASPLLRNSLNIKSLLSAVNTSTGKVDFNLPLFKITTTSDVQFEFTLKYSGSNLNSSLFGIGWDLALDYIAVDYGGIIDSYAHKFFWVTSCGVFKLRRKANFENLFEFEELEETDVIFDPVKQTWIIKTSKGVSRTYGGGINDQQTRGNGISWMIGWKYWNDIGSETRNQCLYPTRWYLTKLNDEKNFINFKYKEIIPQNKYYTEEMQLMSAISNHNCKFQFDYCQKNENEYKNEILTSTINNEHSFIEQAYICKHYVSKVGLVTPLQVQTVEFSYLIQSDFKRILSSISQAEDTNGALFTFNYVFMNRSFQTVLNSIILANRSEIKFAYEEKQINKKNNALEHLRGVYEVKQHPEITIGSDIFILSEINVFSNLDLSISKVMSKEKIEKISIERQIKSYQIFAQDENKFGILLDELTGKQTLIMYSLDRLLKPKYYTFDVNIKYTCWSNDFFAYIDGYQNVVIISWSDELKDWIETRINITHLKLENECFFISNGYAILIYDDNNLWTLFRNLKGIWKINHLKTASNYYTDSCNLINRFDLKSELKDQIFESLKLSVVSFSKNLICLNSVIEKDGKLGNRLNMLVLDSNYILVSDDVYTHLQEALSDISLKEPLEIKFFENEKFEADLHYKIVDNRIVLHFKTQNDHIFNIENQNYQLKRKYNLNKQFIKITVINCDDDDDEELDSKEISYCDEMRGLFLVNLVNYMPQLILNEVSCGNERWLYNGHTWLRRVDDEHLKERPIGSNLYLSKRQGKTFKLYSNQNSSNILLFDFNTENLEDITNGYPSYIAYKKNENEIWLMLINNNNKIVYNEKIANGHLTQWSNSQLLITVKTNTNTTYFDYNQTRVSIHPHPANLLNNDYNAVVVSSLIKVENDEYTTGYAYDDELVLSSENNSVIYRKTKTFPGNNQHLYGWIEEKNDARGFKVHMFDSNGIEIKRKTKINEKDKKNNEKTIEKWENIDYSIYSSDGLFKVAEFRYAKPVNDEAAYYGFENYELKSNWNFNEDYCEKNGWPLTGKRYLRLFYRNDSLTNENDCLTRTFTPKEQKKIYLASCWIRGLNRIPGESIEEFQAIVKTNNGIVVCVLNANLIYNHLEWSYLEIVVNLENICKKNLALETVLYSIKLKVKPSLVNQVLDIDHIKWSPLITQFSAYVYHEDTKQVTSFINESSLIKRVIYDIEYNPLAVIERNGSVSEINLIYTPVYIDKNKLKAIIKLKPSIGFYEDFCAFSFQNRWFANDKSAWNRAYGCLIHTKENIISNLTLEPFPFDYVKSVGLYFNLKLSQNTSSFKIYLAGHFVQFEINSIKCNEYVIKRSISETANYLLIVSYDRVFLWQNGELIVDNRFKVKNPDTPNISFTAGGSIYLTKLFVFADAQIQIRYENSIGIPIQTIQFEDYNSSIVTQTIYDDLMRQTIVTKNTRIMDEDDSNKKPLLKYQVDFVTNTSKNDKNSVWYTKKLLGDVNKFNPLDEGYCYYRTNYANNPSNEKVEISQPGYEFTIENGHTFKFSDESNCDFIEILFPREQGFTQNVIEQPNETKKITVLDINDNRVAVCVKTRTYNHMLTTYEYDEQNRLIKVLPPAYHAHLKIDTIHKTKSFKELSQEIEKNDYLKAIQINYASTIAYTKEGLISERVTPETGKQVMIYSKDKLLRFILKHDKKQQTTPYIILYFQYNQWGQIIEKGLSNNVRIERDQLQRIANEYTVLPDCVAIDINMCEINLSEPKSRGNMKKNFIKNIDSEFNESCLLTNEGHVSDKMIHFNLENGESKLRYQSQFNGKHMKSITYPAFYQGNILNVLQKYDHLGRLTSIGTQDDPFKWVSFKYSPEGNLIQETHKGINNINRCYKYNSPGFLTEIDDEFTQEKLKYTEGSYGQNGYYDSTVAETRFKLKWATNCDPRGLSISAEVIADYFKIKFETAKLIINRLKNGKFLDENNRVIRQFMPLDSHIYLDTNIDGIKMADLFSKYYPMCEYGHQYAYGNHMELVAAKYSIDDKNFHSSPLSQISFHQQNKSSITVSQSKAIWEILKRNNYIYPNYEVNAEGTSQINDNFWIDKEAIRVHLKDFLKFEYVLPTYLEQYYYNRAVPTQESFEKQFIIWLGVNESNVCKEAIKNYLQPAKQLLSILKEKKYFYSANESDGYCTLFKKELHQQLASYKQIFPEIIKTLAMQRKNDLGQTSADLNSFRIDPNGNHGLFWNGFTRYELNYSNENPNQISHITYKAFVEHDGYEPLKTFEMRHDAFGNVIRADHKCIKQIVYNQVNNKAIKFVLNDNRKILFEYDNQGLRVRKVVLNSNNAISKEIMYLRDEKGRCVFEKEILYEIDKAKSETDTVYIHGPRCLVAIIQNDKYYSILTDHNGSIRTVIENEEVVAAFDYMPYGSLLRSYGRFANKIRYRFNGKEWDDELELYDFHARFYDPNIGRFYQIDPQEQYPSPYKYAGNSPISMIDPDGELAFLVPLLMGGFALGGAYLGGAAANNAWNPSDWKWKNASTWLGILGGGICGSLMPIGATFSLGGLMAAGMTSVGAIALTTSAGITVAYFSMAATNKSWNPGKWKWKRPGTWNGAFQGFAFGSGIIGGAYAWYNMYNGLGVVMKGAMIAGSTIGGLGLGYLGGASANHDWNPTKWKFNASTVYGVFGGAFAGFMLPLVLQAPVNFVKSFSSTSGKLLAGAGVVLTTCSVTYIMVSEANHTYDITKWNMKSAHTYEALFGGIMFGLALPELVRNLPEAVKMMEDTWKMIIYEIRDTKTEFVNNDTTQRKDCKEAAKIRDHVKEISRLIDEFEARFTEIIETAELKFNNTVITAVEMNDGKILFRVSGNRSINCQGLYDPENGLQYINVNFENGSNNIQGQFDNLVAPKLNAETIIQQTNGSIHPSNCAEPHVMQMVIENGYQLNQIKHMYSKWNGQLPQDQFRAAKRLTDPPKQAGGAAKRCIRCEITTSILDNATFFSDFADGFHRNSAIWNHYYDRFNASWLQNNRNLQVPLFQLSSTIRTRPLPRRD